MFSLIFTAIDETTGTDDFLSVANQLTHFIRIQVPVMQDIRNWLRSGERLRLN